jgi:O-antigen ligase
LFSIAVSHIFLGLALVALLGSGLKLRFPPFWLPLAVFIAGTIISLAASVDPASGRPQLRKFFVFVILLCAASVLTDIRHIRWLLITIAAGAGLSALRALIQFVEKYERSISLGQNFYQSYVSDRIAGFMSHWMTFSSQAMYGFLIMVALLLFGGGLFKRAWLWGLCAAILGAALVLGLTRIVWLGSAAGTIYLFACWRPKWLFALPVVAAAGFWLAPDFVRARIQSAVTPHGELDSNQHRIITLRTGLRMIEAHPWLGLGPEQVNARFNEFIPPDVPQPLPSGWYGHLHNIYVHYAAERGIPTLLALLWMLGVIARDLFLAVRSDPRPASDEKFILQSGLAVLVATLVVGVMEHNLGDSEVLMLFLAITACAYTARDSLRAGAQVNA